MASIFTQRQWAKIDHSAPPEEGCLVRAGGVVARARLNPTTGAWVYDVPGGTLTLDFVPREWCPYETADV